jgi:hypothetical protein
MRNLWFLARSAQLHGPCSHRSQRSLAGLPAPVPQPLSTTLTPPEPNPGPPWPAAPALQTSLEHRRHQVEPTLLGLQEMLTYGLRGLCAYTHHAEVLGQRNPEVDRFVAEAYAFLCSEDATSVDKVLGMVLKCGEVNLKAMQILDEGHTSK